MAAAAKPRRKTVKKNKLPEPLPLGFELTDTFKNHWVVGEEIGSGGFGVVYFVTGGKDNNTPRPKDYDFVMKVEFHENGPLYTELHFYRNIGKPEHIQEWERKKKLDYLGMSACHGLGSFEYKEKKYRFLVLQRYGTDLQKLLDKNENVFSLKTAYTVGIAVLNVLEYIHSSGYLHGDIKAANLLCGRKKGLENRIYLVDMGLATKYITGEGHRKEVPDPKKAHNGTIEFISRDSHRGTPCTRRSDFETLGYNLVHWLSNNLPWQGMDKVVEVSGRKEESMKDIKSFLRNVFPSGIPLGLAEYLTYVKKLKYDETPDYSHCRKLLSNAIVSQGFKLDGKLSLGVKKKNNIASTVAPLFDAPSSSSSVKENIKKNNVPKPASSKRKRDKVPIKLDPGITPTPAMLQLLNKNS